MPDPHLLFRNRLDAITLSGAHLRPRGTWLWRERLSRVLRGCYAAVVPVVHPSSCGAVRIRINSSPLEEAMAPQTRLLLNKVGKRSTTCNRFALHF
jgi:hypothetical protein